MMPVRNLRSRENWPTPARQSDGGEAGSVRSVQQARGILLQQVNQRQLGGDVRCVVRWKGRHLDSVLLHALAEFQGDDLRNGFPRLLRCPPEVAPRPFQPGFPEIDTLYAKFQGGLRIVMVRVGMGEEDHLDVRPFRDHVGGRRSEVEQNHLTHSKLQLYDHTKPIIHLHATLSLSITSIRRSMTEILTDICWRRCTGLLAQMWDRLFFFGFSKTC